MDDNRLLQTLDSTARAALTQVVTVHLRARDVIYDAGTPLLHVYFPLTAVVSLVSNMESGASAEVALVGCEGMLGLNAVLGATDDVTTAVVQIGGTALRAPVGAIQEARVQFASMRRMLDLYSQARFIQVAQTAACNRLHTVEARLARWLLALDERLTGHVFTISRQLIADMLGVHRPTVSVELKRLRTHGCIQFRGRAVAITDRAALEGHACECHRVLRAEFERLLTRSHVALGIFEETVSSPSADATARKDSAAEVFRELAGRLLQATLREQEAREQAERANEVKDQFLATLSHELRTPLNAILGWCSILEGHHDPTHAHGLEAIRHNAGVQLRLVEDLLDAARQTVAPVTLQPTTVQIADLVEDTVDAFRPLANEKGITLNVSGAERTLISADAERLRQVLLNVLTNAVKFTDAEGAIDVAVTAAESDVQVRIHDTGRGIAAELLPHVFERFRQGSHDPHQGLGLGLTIARAIVERHDGTMQIDSPGEGLGATVTITLPASAPGR